MEPGLALKLLGLQNADYWASPQRSEIPWVGPVLRFPEALQAPLTVAEIPSPGASSSPTVWRRAVA